MKTLVVIRTADPHRQAEALRAALGVTLRGASVEVLVDEPLHTPLAQRAADTLRAFGHSVGPLRDLGAAIARADTLEVWTDAATDAATVTATVTAHSARDSRSTTRGRRVLHLVRTALPPGVVAEGDQVVYLDETVDHDHLVQLAFAADVVVTW